MSLLPRSASSDDTPIFWFSGMFAEDSPREIGENEARAAQKPPLLKRILAVVAAVAIMAATMATLIGLCIIIPSAALIAIGALALLAVSIPSILMLGNYFMTGHFLNPNQY